MFGSTNTKLWSGDTQYGYIMAEYPEGSQCQITRELDDKILKARGTSGNWAFALPEVIGLKVPKEYQEVKYLQSSGTQWIDTGYKFQPTTEIDIDFTWLALNYDTDIIGSDGGSGSICILLNRYDRNKNRALINQLVDNWSSQDYTLNTLYSASIQSASGTTNITINGDVWNTLSQTVTSAYTLLLFGRKGSNGAGNLATCRIYSCRITQGGTSVREFIPCYRKTDSVAGMYDIVTQTFYTNQGTGTFITGPVVGGDEWTAYCTDGENEAERKVNILYNGDVQSAQLYYGVPAEYQTVEYIQSPDTGTGSGSSITGAAFIDTNVGWPGYTTFQLIIDFMPLKSDTYQAIMASQDSPITMIHQSTSNKVTINWQEGSTTTEGDLAINTRHVLNYQVTETSSICFLDDTQIYSSATHPSISKNSKLPLLVEYWNNEYRYAMQAKLYSAKIIINGQVIRDFSPCYRKSDDIVGLWDSINNNFYTSAGTGLFIAGPDI